LVSDVSEPVYLALVFEESQCDAVYWSVAPTFVEEASSAIEMVEIVAVLFAPPKAQVADLEIGPEVAC